MFLRKEQYGLKPIEKEDLQWIKGLRNNQNNWVNLEHVFPLNMNIQENWLQKINQDNSKEYFIFTNLENKNIGLIRITDIDYINKKSCVGMDIDEKYRGQKLSYIAYELIFDYLFNYKNMNRLHLFVLESNTIALNLYKKLGFIQEGVQREAIVRDNKKFDYIMMSILHSEYVDKRKNKGQ